MPPLRFRTRRQTLRSAARHRRALAAAVIEAVEPRTLLTTYYLSPGGSDAAAGTSANAAWKTPAKINSVDLEPGDSVLFQGGQTFNLQTTGANLVSDPGFESGNFNTWTESFDATSGNSSLTPTAANLHSGTRGLKLSGTTAGGRGEALTGKLKAGSTYLLSLWAKLLSGTGKAQGGVTFYSGGAKVGGTSFTLATSSSFAQYTATLAAPSSFDYADVWITKDAGTSILYADDVSVTSISGALTFDASDSGTSSSPVTIGSYGTGRATLLAGDDSAIWADNTQGMVVKDLIVQGNWNGLAATGTNDASGIYFTNELGNNGKLNYIRIDDLDVSGFKWGGIDIQGQNGKAGYSDVRITNSASHDNGDCGIRVEGEFNASSTLYSDSGVYIGYCTSYNNGGIPNLGRNSGTGIIIGDTDGGVIERCVAYNNGRNCNNNGGGPIGIWAWDSNNITIQFCESHHNQTGSNSLDGGGFDFDGGVTNSVMQYNYSHDNDGAGYLLYQFSSARTFGWNTVRYNVSQNDARQGHYAGIYLGGGTGVNNNWIYNNVVYLTPTSDSSIAAIKITGVGSNIKIRNNIAFTSGGVKVLNSNSAYATTSVLLQGNDYYANGGTTSFLWGSTTYTDLSSWRSATGQEKYNGASTGMTVNPQLNSAGGGGTIGDATQLNTLSAYQLSSSSPVIDHGVNLSWFSINPGPYDYFGNTSVSNSTQDIGAYEFAVPVQSPPPDPNPNPPPPPPPPPPPVDPPPSAPPSSITGTSGDDSFILRIYGGQAQIFVNKATNTNPSYVWAPGTFDFYSISGGGGNDTLTVDLSNGNPLPNVALIYDGGGGTGDRVVVTLGGWGDGTTTLTNGAITPGGTDGPRIIQSNIEALDVNTATTSTNVPAGGDRLSIGVAAGAQLYVIGPQHLGTLAIDGSALVAAGRYSTLDVRSLNLSATGKLDLTDNNLIVDYDTSGTSPLGNWQNGAYTGLLGQVDLGMNGKSWDGKNGITSSSAQADPRTALGIAEASDALGLSSGQTAVFGGQTVDATAVLIKYTWCGDTNLDGTVNIDDYTRIDAHNAAGPSYATGDINLDGRVNIDDFFLIDGNVLAQGAAM